MTTPPKGNAVRSTIKSVNDELQGTIGRVNALEDILSRTQLRSSHPDLGRKIGQLDRDLRSIERRLAKSNTSEDLQALMSEITRVDARSTELFTELDDRLRAIEGWRREIDPAIERLSNRLTSVNDRVDANTEIISRIVPKSFNWIAGGITFGILLAIWLFWYLPTDFGVPVMNAKGKPTGSYVGSQLDTLWGDLLGLLVVVLAAAAVGYIFETSSRRKALVPVKTAEAPAAADTRVQPAIANAHRSNDVVPARAAS
jgi:hypothetical protein